MPSLFGPSSDTPPSDNTSQPEAKPMTIGNPSPDKQKPITLTKDMLGSAGLDDLAEGDTFTVKLTGVVTKADDSGVTADVSEAADGEVHSDEPGGSEEDDQAQPEDDGFQAPKGKIEMGPPKGFKL